MLRRALRFRRSVYNNITPCVDDTDEPLERKWRAWVEQESFKRCESLKLEFLDILHADEADWCIICSAMMAKPR